MSGQFEGRNVIVTGGGRGIGRATACAFARAGAQVLVTARSEGELQETVRLIEHEGGNAWYAVCDVQDDARIEEVVAGALERWGRIHVLVNNAGIDDDTPFLEVDRDRWRQVIAVNLTAAFVFAQTVARTMASSGGGAILHTASIDASGGDGTYVAYNAAKAGLLGLSRTMAFELAKHGIRSNCVSPGFTHTEMTANAVGPTMMEYLNGSFDRVPMRRLVTTEEVANAFLFLASDGASGITGIDLRVDCGLTANWYILETLPAEGASA
jgi:meso-butanediol dehydrogenase / (S,S)-butanediol dehydrogenase / diacetyl reductase